MDNLKEALESNFLTTNRALSGTVTLLKKNDKPELARRAQVVLQELVMIYTEAFNLEPDKALRRMLGIDKSMPSNMVDLSSIQ